MLLNIFYLTTIIKPAIKYAKASCRTWSGIHCPVWIALRFTACPAFAGTIPYDVFCCQIYNMGAKRMSATTPSATKPSVANSRKERNHILSYRVIWKKCWKAFRDNTLWPSRSGHTVLLGYSLGFRRGHIFILMKTFPIFISAYQWTLGCKYQQ